MGGLLAKLSGASKQLTGRDRLILESVRRMGVLTTNQIQELWFSSDKACKRRLLKLHKLGVIKRLNRAAVNDPYYYFVGRVPKSSKILDHSLGVNDIRVRVERAIRDLGWELLSWMEPNELQPLLSTRSALAPDAYFQIARQIDGDTRRSGLFLEYERTVRPSSVLMSKLRRYADIYHSGFYRQKFGIRGMRVLVVYSSDLTVSADKRVELGLQVCRKVGFPQVRFATLEQIKSVSAVDILLKPIWRRPDQEEACPLYEAG
jgi:hypothetical protein